MSMEEHAHDHPHAGVHAAEGPLTHYQLMEVA